MHQTHRSTPQNPSARVRAIREAHHQKWAANDPAGHAEAVARQQALDAVPIPQSLATPVGARPWERQAYQGARELYREIFVSGAEGMELRNLGTRMGKERRQAGLKLLRGTEAVMETKESREGTQVPVIVLRAVRWEVTHG